MNFSIGTHNKTKRLRVIIRYDIRMNEIVSGKT